MSIFQQLGAPGVINAAGKLTALGGSAQSAAVAAAQADAAGSHVDLAQLRVRAGQLIAEHCAAEAASVTSGAAAGVAISVAACITGTDLARVERLPDSDGWTNAVALQAGHWVSAGGAPVEQMIRVGGGRPLMFGTPEAVTDADLESILTQPLAALCYVCSHHTIREGRLSLERCIASCHEQEVPVIVDAAAEDDLRYFTGLGADLVTYSGGKAPGGPTAGFVVGRRELIAACELQNRGIARPMKAGKEQIAGLLVALDEYANVDAAAEEDRRARVNAIIEAAVAGAPGVHVWRHADEAGRRIERVAISAADDAFDVNRLIRFLESAEPSVRTRNTHLHEGMVLFDPRELTEAQASRVGRLLESFFDATF